MCVNFHDLFSLLFFINFLNYLPFSDHYLTCFRIGNWEELDRIRSYPSLRELCVQHVPLLGHDFAELEDGTIAALAFEERDGQLGNKIEHIAPDGSTSTVTQSGTGNTTTVTQGTP